MQYMSNHSTVYKCTVYLSIDCEISQKELSSSVWHLSVTVKGHLGRGIDQISLQYLHILLQK